MIEKKQRKMLMLEKLLNGKELNQGIMLAFLGNNLAKKLLDELPDEYYCEFVISPPDEKYSDYFCIFNYKKKMRIAYIGVPSDTEEGEVIIRPILRNIEKLKFEERIVVIAMLKEISADLDIPVEKKIKI